jgi:FKBP-type peptidyl-prolyl cis-trans isomerase
MAVLVASLVFVGCDGARTTRPTLLPSSGLRYTDVRLGAGARAENGKMLTVHYIIRLGDGTEIDNSYDRGQPFEFLLGAGDVIRGWDEGIRGMRVGGKRRLWIPSELAYGERGLPGGIPPNATLISDVELLAVTPAPP